MGKQFNKEEKERIDENIHLILSETKHRFEHQKEAWRDLSKKVFYLLGFISLFVGFIIADDLTKKLQA